MPRMSASEAFVETLVAQGVPPEQVFASVTEEVERLFLAEAAKEKIDIDPLSGEEVQTLVEEVSHTPADVVARVRAALDGK